MAPNTNTSMVNHRSCVLMGVMSPYPTVVIVVSAQYSDVEYCTRHAHHPTPPVSTVGLPQAAGKGSGGARPLPAGNLRAR